MKLFITNSYLVSSCFRPLVFKYVLYFVQSDRPNVKLTPSNVRWSTLFLSIPVTIFRQPIY